MLLRGRTTRVFKVLALKSGTPSWGLTRLERDGLRLAQSGIDEADAADEGVVGEGVRRTSARDVV
jgi:hypothetical protein